MDRDTLLKRIIESFNLQKEKLETIIERMDRAFNHGLHEDPNVFHHSPIKMLPTYLSVVPDGSEQGRFFAIDLGGTNLRFFEIDVVGEKLIPRAYHFQVPEQAMVGEASDLFGFLATCIRECLEKLQMLEKEIEYLGFTFSFPINQQALNSGLLMRWTKGFHTSGVIGVDVVRLLREACAKENLKIKDFVLINDTTGTLLCGAFEDKDTAIGIINGTGTNACYIEEISKVRKWKTITPHKKVLINTEWGAFGEDGSLNEILTEFDLEIDRKSINVGQQIFEKMVSGMYVGELARLAIVKINSSQSLFNGLQIEKLQERGAFPARLLSESYDKEVFINSFEEIFFVRIDDTAFQIMAQICDAVAQRSAKLTGAGLAAILTRLGTHRAVIAADGSMFKRHPRFTSYVKDAVHDLLPEHIFDVIFAEDGSGKGAALAACVASSQIHSSGDT